MCEKCPNTGKYGPEKTLYLETFYTVSFPRWIFKPSPVGFVISPLEYLLLDLHPENFENLPFCTMT